MLIFKYLWMSVSVMRFFKLEVNEKRAGHLARIFLKY